MAQNVESVGQLGRPIQMIMVIEMRIIQWMHGHKRLNRARNEKKTREERITWFEHIKRKCKAYKHIQQIASRT